MLQDATLLSPFSSSHSPLLSQDSLLRPPWHCMSPSQPLSMLIWGWLTFSIDVTEARRCWVRDSRDAVLSPSWRRASSIDGELIDGTWSWSTGCCGAHPTVAATLPGLLTAFDHQVMHLRSRCCHSLEAFFASTPVYCNTLCLTKAYVERTAQATSETQICRSVRPVLAARWPEVAILLSKSLSCDGPLYLRDHLSPCAIPLQLRVDTSQPDLCCKGSWVTIESFPGPWSCLSLPDLCGLNFNFLRACCKSCIFLQGFEGSIKKLFECAFEIFLTSLSSAWYKLFSTRCYLNCWQVS